MAKTHLSLMAPRAMQGREEAEEEEEDERCSWVVAIPIPACSSWAFWNTTCGGCCGVDDEDGETKTEVPWKRVKELLGACKAASKAVGSFNSTAWRLRSRALPLKVWTMPRVRDDGGMCGCLLCMGWRW